MPKAEGVYGTTNHHTTLLHLLLYPDESHWDDAGISYHDIESEQEAEKKYKQRYVSGKYRTSVIVFEGRVVAAPYNDQGPYVGQADILDAGQKILRVGEIK